MRAHQYIVGTGYYNRHGSRGDSLAWFYSLWLENTLWFSDPFAIYILAGGDGLLPKDQFGDKLANKPPPIIWTDVLGDLGHCGQVLSGEKPYHFCGGSITWMTLAMLAYANECDFVYKEQDVLSFGPCIETMYAEIGTKGCIFGRAKSMPCANSFMLVKHSFIPELIRLYLGTPHERDPQQICETKFVRLEQQHPQHFCRFSFGVDRDRPFDMKAPAWYAQKFSVEELKSLGSAKLIPQTALDNMPQTEKAFTNC